MVTPDDLEAFTKELAEADRPVGNGSRPDTTPPAPRGRTDAQRQKAIADAERTLAKAGVA